MGCIKLKHIEHKALSVFNENLKVVKEKREAPIFFMLDYFPYGKVLREYINTPERYLTTQHERDQETGLDYRGARYYDSDVARFLSLDPLAKEYPSLSDYSYVAGNPIMFIDPTGKSIENSGNGEDDLIKRARAKVAREKAIIEAKKVQQAKRTTQAATNYTSYELLRSAQVRTLYGSTVSTLDPRNTTARTAVKKLARDITPPVTRSVVENSRPSLKAKSGSNGSANKTNVKANNIASNMGMAGAGLVVLNTANSANNIIQADNKIDATIEETTTVIGGVSGAALGAEAGAAIGAFFGGVGAIPGAVIGGIVGSFLGSEIGHGAGNEINELRD